jgi:hypothetical protein
MAETTADPTVIPINPAAAEARREGTAAATVEARPGQHQSAQAINSSTDRGQRLPPVAVQSDDPQSPRSLSPFRIKDIQVGKPDGRGVTVTHVYAAQSDEYAIYEAGEVMVAFADDPNKAKEQRKLVVPLSVLRAELNSLLPGLRCRALCEKQLAYALQLALDGDLDGAKSTVTAAKAFALGRRAAAGRFQYLKWSAGAAAIILVLLFLAGCIDFTIRPTTSGSPARQAWSARHSRLLLQSVGGPSHSILTSSIMWRTARCVSRSG